MRERGAFRFFTVMLIVTILFFLIVADDVNQDSSTAGDVPTVIINGRVFEPGYAEGGDSGRMIVVVDRADLFAGENTVEIRRGNAPPSTMTADLPDASQKH